MGAVVVLLYFMVGTLCASQPMPLGAAWHHSVADLGGKASIELKQPVSPAVDSLKVEYGMFADHIFLKGQNVNLHFTLPHKIDLEDGEVLSVENQKCSKQGCACHVEGTVLLKTEDKMKKHVYVRKPGKSSTEFVERVWLSGARQPENFCTYMVDTKFKKLVITRPLCGYRNGSQSVVNIVVHLDSVPDMSVDVELRDAQNKTIREESNGVDFLFSGVPYVRCKQRSRPY